MKNEFILSVSETAPDRSSNSSQERTCEECGRQFFSSSQWVYRFDVKGHTYWFCRYNCHRAGEKKLEAQMAKNRSRAGRKKELSKKSSKEVLEKDLRAGLPIAAIARKHEVSAQNVHNWIKSYGLAGIQGVKKPIDKPQSAGDDFDIVADQDGRLKEIMAKPLSEEMVQGSPTLAEIEQFHTDTEIQELPRVKFDNPFSTIIDSPKGEDNPQVNQIKEEPAAPIVDTIEELWQGVDNGLKNIQIKYAEQADKEFRAHLLSLVLAVTHGRGI